ncbi:SigE family RNA polymerase sigma factor [Lentzea sp. NPDC058450]|uniref:SigE family RNA polymerase sigma factor n=1 Tax=Lentzea sp. NPDC058450 TaxID=3346505 RepID=UPI00364B0039
MDRDSEFGEFVDARALVMRRTAYLLCGDWHRAEDIVQQALIKMYVAWSRVRKDSVDAYARKVLVRTAIDETRRGFFQRERIVDAVPERAVTDATTDPDLRKALDALPAGQRAVVVLRYWEDLSITETARILGRTEGTVKSQAAKGLAALRDLLENEPVSRIHTSEVIRRGRTRLVRRRAAIAGALAFVLVVGFGTAGYLARPQLTSADQTGAASSGLNADVALTNALSTAGVLPAGVTAQDVPGAKALQFFERQGRHYAGALLKDAQGTSALTIMLYRDPGATPPACTPEEGADCRIEKVGDIEVRSSLSRRENGVLAHDVRSYRADGTYIEIRSVNVGEFLPDGPVLLESNSPPSRQEPVLGRDALIKIATLPGLTF